jgi:hypothetical protein
MRKCREKRTWCSRKASQSAMISSQFSKLTTSQTGRLGCAYRVYRKCWVRRTPQKPDLEPDFEPDFEPDLEPVFKIQRFLRSATKSSATKK